MHAAMMSPMMALSRVFFRWMASMTRVMEGRLPVGRRRRVSEWCGVHVSRSERNEQEKGGSGKTATMLLASQSTG